MDFLPSIWKIYIHILACQFQNVDELLLGLASLGFELEDCQLAVEAGNNTLESAVEWWAINEFNLFLQSHTWLSVTVLFEKQL